LHARPAAKFLRTVREYRSEIRAAKNGTEVDGTSFFGLMLLSAACGDKLRIRIRGTDAAEVMGAIERLIRSGFDED
jgi:phosphocarrier protein HPr